MRLITVVITCLLSFFQGAEARPRGAPDNRVQLSFASYGGVCDGVTDDTLAFRAFKNANQNTIPTQLNLPSGTCLFTPGSGDNQYLIKGVQNLVVQGAGSGSTTIKSTASGGGAYLFLGGKGQFQDNLHSIRTNDANPGDSCVTLKNSPSVTISNVTNNLSNPASFTASATLTSPLTVTMTVTAVGSGTIAAGAYIMNATSNVGGFARIQPYGTSGTTGAGGTGTYILSITDGSFASFSSQNVRTLPASFTADYGVTNAGLLTVTSVDDGTITPGMYVFRQSGVLGNPVTILPYGTSGTTGVGGTGTYALSVKPTSNLASSGFLGNGQIRLTLNSTSGLTSGDTVPFTAITGTGVLPQRTIGLQWIKVINGTQVDLFQKEFNGAYTSGGAGGGDQTSLFPVGSKVLMTGWANQAYYAAAYGFPSNPNFYEYKTVASVNSTTHQVCFDTPLANTYKAAWPQYNAGSQFEVDPGGPATLYVLDPTWETTVVYKDLTIDSTPASTTVGRSSTFQNVSMTGALCAIPSQNETLNWINVTGTNCVIEVDKIIGTWNVTNSSVFKFDYQSSSVNISNIDGLTATGGGGTGGVFGSGKKMNMQNSTLDIWTVGNFSDAAYGASNESICNNCTVNNAINGLVNGMRVDTPTIPWSMASGVITIPLIYSWAGQYEIQTKILVPGSYYVWRGSSPTGTLWGYVGKVVSVTSDTENAYIQTSEAGGFPTGGYAATNLSISGHPAPKFTASFTAGSANGVKLFNGCTALAPMYSCQNYTYTGGALGATSGPIDFMLGYLDTFTFTNNVPYTNTGALTWTPTSNSWPTMKADFSLVNFGGSSSPDGQAIINTKLPSSGGGGTRTLTTSGSTGAQTGDTLTPPTATNWFGRKPFAGPAFSANTPSDSPQVSMSLRTNQSLPP